MINFNKNNLDQATSPYVQQHKDNPVYWQEWSPEVLEYAKKNNKIILVSVGYATCHWCHVMAQEAFSNSEIANYLNKHFVSIKVDKEQRPDIDNYYMNFCQETQGQGGWPLNVFLTAELKPFLAVTYVPVTARYGLPGFLDLLRHIQRSYEQQSAKIPMYYPQIHSPEHIEEPELIEVIKKNFTGTGFGAGPQFPPHNTLLFLLSYYEKNKDSDSKKILETLLERMAMQGLHDHLQGGFYRYCIDNSWTIPHFEKMLYDQAMLLWVYSLAYKTLQKPFYKTIVEKILTCLEDTYADHLYYAAHDADTDHQEGSTYLWDVTELQQNLSEEEYHRFQQVYKLEKNFEGKIHLIKCTNTFLPQIEQKLLRLRKKRKQPFTDKKYITSWNALLGIGLIMASRHCNNSMAKCKAELLFKNILRNHYPQGILHHSSHDGKLQPGEFLEDYATVLLFATYLYEDTGEHKDLIAMLYTQLQKFYQGQWIESKNTDFMEISAQTYDHPTPSSASLAAMAKLRAEIILGKEYVVAGYKQPVQHDFYNLMVFMKHWHIIHLPHTIEWKHLGANSMQIYDPKIQDCYQQKCVEFKDVTQLLGAIRSQTH
ncbi:MAG: DUF255 domain-containing protein [Nanoarchaeota archaeon]|nr:DUF255 domain-containing protein [Nanoarchaeota archaeon]